MSRKILLDAEIIEGALHLQEKEKKLLDKLTKSGFELFITSTMLSELLLSKDIDKNELKKIITSNFKIISVTGAEIIKSLDYLYSPKVASFYSFRRAVGNGYFIVKDKNVLNLNLDLGIKVLTLDEAINSKEIFKDENPSYIPMLDLAREYRSMMEEIDEAILKAVADAKYILGQQVNELEEKIAEYVGTKYAIGVSSGTDALVISLRALAIQRKKQEYWDKGDFIITTPLTFTATGDAILRAGATPLFVDIDIDTYTIDPNQVKDAVKKYGKKVKGILPVHLYGHPADMSAIMEIAKNYDLFVVEDCAQSLGARWEGEQTGSFGNAGCFSFFPTKPLGGFGDGGMITTNDENLYEIMLMLRKHGGKDKYNVEHIGYNARLDTLQASVLLAKFPYLDRMNKKRREIAKRYNEYLKDVEWIKIPYEHPKAYHVYHQYTIRILNRDRDRIRKELKQRGVQTMVYYPVPLHMMALFTNRCVCFGDLKNCQVSNSILSLPVVLQEEKYFLDLINTMWR